MTSKQLSEALFQIFQLTFNLWHIKFDIWLNPLLHKSHLYGRSFVCVKIWFLRLPFWWNALWHRWHWCGFSFVCVFLCEISVETRLNVLSHSSQMYGRSAEWMARCCDSVDIWRNALPHTRHVYLRSSVCVGMWRIRVYWWVNSFRPNGRERNKKNSRFWGFVFSKFNRNVKNSNWLFFNKVQAIFYKHNQKFCIHWQHCTVSDIHRVVHTLATV